MIDPLSSISLASAIVQLIDFGYKTVRGTFEIYRTSQGALAENIDIEHATQDIRRLSDKVSDCTCGPSANVLTDDEKELQALANESREIANELLIILQGLKVTDAPGKSQKWQSFRVALASSMPNNKNKILDLEKRLETSQKQIYRRLLIMMSHEQSKIRLSLDHLAHERIDEMRIDIIRAIQSSSSQLKDDYLLEMSIKIQELDRRIQETRKDQIFQSLKLSIVKAREFSIEPQPSAFQWIFDELDAAQGKGGLRNWLRSDSKMFWISGKCGSGKSTLMKYLIQDPRTKQHLCQWADQVCIVSYFSWYAGEDLQRSAQGMFQSLLYDILGQNPSLIQLACSDLMAKTGQTPLEWTRKETTEAFARLTTDRTGIRICIFIDGLDEFGENLQDMIIVLKSMAKNPNVKLCFSSRPWEIFLKAFTEIEKVIVEERSKADIESYVDHALRQDENFIQLARENSQVVDIPKEICEMSNGVFLWATLITNELRKGLGNADSISELRRRLLQFPKNLTAFYECAFDRIDPFYEKETAQILQMLVATKGTLPLNTLAFYDLARKASDGCLNFSDHYSPSEVDAAFKSCNTRLNSRCQDFVTLQRMPGWQVTARAISFLHQTAAQFLSTPHMRNRLALAAGPQFNAKHCLIKATLAEIRHIVNKNDSPDVRNRCKQTRKDIVAKLTQRMLRYLGQAEHEDGITYPSLLEELDEVLQSFMATLIPKHPPVDHWTKSSIFRESGIAKAIRNNSSGNQLPYLLILAIKEDLRLYIAWKTQREPKLLSKLQDPPPLWYAFTNTDWLRAVPDGSVADAGMARFLIENRANPFHTVSCDEIEHGMKISVFELFFRKLHQQRSIPTDSQFEAAKILLGNSAYPLHYIRVGSSIDYHPERLPIRSILQSAFHRVQVAELNWLIKQHRFASVLTWWDQSLLGRTIAIMHFVFIDAIRLHNTFALWSLRFTTGMIKEIGKEQPKYDASSDPGDVFDEWPFNVIFYLVLLGIAVFVLIWLGIIRFVSYMVYSRLWDLLHAAQNHPSFAKYP